MSKVIQYHYGDLLYSFTTEAWFNATEAAARFGKRLSHWLDNAETLEYIRALDEVSTGKPSVILNSRKSGYLKTRRGAPETGGGSAAMNSPNQGDNMNNSSKKLPEIEDLRFLLELAENWANLDEKSLKHRAIYRPMQIAKASPMLAAAVEIFDWIASFEQGKNLLREENFIRHGKQVKERSIGISLTC